MAVTRSTAPGRGAPGPSTGAILRVTVLTVGSGNYIKSSDCTAIMVELVAGGGAGGSADGGGSNAGCGAGGGGGGYLRKFIDNPDSSCAYVVGAKGAKGASGNNSGGSGADTTFINNSVTYTAKAGVGGGSVGAAGTSVLLVTGGSGGAVSTNGDVNGAGCAGEHAHRLSGTLARSGKGGDGPFGGGGKALVAAAAGNAGSAPGAGGGGALSTTTTDQQGGDGSDGVIIVTEYS